MLVADNKEVLAASELFKQSEGIDTDPAAGLLSRSSPKQPFLAASRGKRVCSCTSPGLGG